MSLIETVNLCQRYDKRDVLKSINLKIDKGEAFALIGPTGAGKTTLLRLIDLLDAPASGKIYFDGINVTESSRIRLETRRRMAFVLQKPLLFNASVYDNIAYGLKWRGDRGDNINNHQKIDNILEMVDLTSFRKRNARTLSGGEAQRVAIARAIVSEPAVLLLDEPTANLDPVSISKIEEVITNITSRHSTTIVMATHDMSQGQRLAGRVAVLLNGEIIQTGNWKEIYRSPQNQKIAGLVGTENIINGMITTNTGQVVTIKARERVIEAISDYPEGEAVSALIRPEDITLALTQVSSSARNSFSGVITRIATFGPLSRIEMDCGFRLVALVTRKSAEEMNLERGKIIYASFKATAVHVINKKEDIR
jgi:tungstate transport system ATP-binding protein